jgi:hypothetical protein
LECHGTWSTRRVPQLQLGDEPLLLLGDEALLLLQLGGEPLTKLGASQCGSRAQLA